MNLGLFLLVGFLGGTTGFLIKLAGQQIPPVLLTILRFGIAAIILLPFLIKHKVQLPQKHRKTIFLSGLALGANIIFFSIGVQHTSVIMSQIIFIPSTIIVAILGYFFLGEKLTKNHILGLVLTVFGMALLISGSIKTQDV